MTLIFVRPYLDTVNYYTRGYHFQSLQCKIFVTFTIPVWSILYSSLTSVISNDLVITLFTDLDLSFISCWTWREDTCSLLVMHTDRWKTCNHFYSSSDRRFRCKIIVYRWHLYPIVQFLSHFAVMLIADCSARCRSRNFLWILRQLRPTFSEGACSVCWGCISQPLIGCHITTHRQTITDIKRGNKKLH